MAHSAQSIRHRLGLAAAAFSLLAAGTFVGSAGVSDLASAQAVGSVASAIVTVEPARILDTRTGVGLPAPITANQSHKLQVTGEIPTRVGSGSVDQTVVPDGATGVLLNVTALRPTAQGFVSVRPGNASGEPDASNLNVATGQVVPNSVTVALADDGTIDLWYGVSGSGSTGILVDVVGYTTESEGGPTGPTGPAGAPGTELFVRTAIVNSGGTAADNGARLTAAVAAVAAASPSASDPWLIALEPGAYEVAALELPGHTRVEGAGRDQTTVTVTGNVASSQGPVTIADLSLDASSLVSNEDLALDRTDVSGGIEIVSADATITDSSLASLAEVILVVSGELVVAGSSLSTLTGKAIVTTNSSVTITSSDVVGADTAVAMSGTGTLSVDHSQLVGGTGVSMQGSMTAEVTYSEIDAGDSFVARAAGTAAFVTATHSVIGGDTAFSGSGTTLQVRLRHTDFRGTVVATTESCLAVTNSLLGFWFQATCP